MDYEQPHQELVKCVVVGDTAVGKTRLICARACNKQVSLSQLLTTHVPTVWAIDQYRIYKDVLERSWEVVDGVNVSLRLWDTFGDHEKDRRFAYGRSDVVLLCFSVTSPISLRNCKAMWYPEIRRFCPQTPVLLVGCKNDLRYMYQDEAYLSIFRENGSFLRATRKSDLVMPDQARAVARELGVHYYETSVLSYYGVNEVFENAIRSALMARRQQRFWMTNLKKVQRPLLQAPFKPPKPPIPEIHVSSSSYDDHIREMFLQQAHTDVLFNAGSVGFLAHRFILAAASPLLHRLLLTDFSNELSTRSSSESSMVSTFGEATQGDFNDDTEHLIRTEIGKPSIRVWEQIKRRSSCQVLSCDSNRRLDISRDMDHPAFTSIRVQQYEGLDHRGNPSSSLQTVITLSKLITPQAMNQVLQFMYTGTIDSRYCELQTAPIGLLLEIRQAAEFLELSDLYLFVSNVHSREEFLNTELKVQYRQDLRKRLRELCVGQGLFSDVRFQLDDGLYPVHRALLMSRCDMFKAMFSGDFRESSAKVIVFPGVAQDTFVQLLTYLYTDELGGAVSYLKCLELLEVANRLCLPRLITLIEQKVVEQLTAKCGSEGDVVEHCLRLLEPCKLHNADQLADWCMNHLCTNYNKLCKRSPKLLRQLHPENQEYLSEHRWPPVWYLKDYDYYEKCASEREKEERPLLKRSSAGCLCFSSKARRSSALITANTITASTNVADAIDADVEALADDHQGVLQAGHQVVAVPNGQHGMDM
ncbi:rho-related BTB domain-containing protein 1 [Frankliniella occidentalis]|uniref:Rho-related BTB domain-containing protein 1 n=1 Tax=Frankliniella occidentalis TaxID=133901 RepID=A0A6J1SZF1_FRAOC|nr:rho-related BTB domain-containing protein 1 [Frankliniella occidentalis]